MASLKDYSKLKGVSDYFTEQSLQDILCMLRNGKNAEILSWDFGEASAKGDSYLSTVNKIKITGIVDGKQEQASIVVKSLPKNIGRRRTYRSEEFFRNEIIFYTKIISEFEKFVKDKGQNQLLCTPRYLASHLDGENDFIALEDVSCLGFGPVSRQNCLDFHQCSMILKSMARFHGISFAFKDQHKEKFAQLADHTHETYMSYEHWDWYKRFHQKLLGIANNALEMEFPDSEAQKRFSSIPFGELFKKSAEMCDRKHAPTSVLSQGDSWAPNFLARKINETEYEVLMLDFQLARCASPILDLSFFIYSCTDKTLWDEHFHDLLKIYHNELSNSVSLLGSDPEKLYPWDTFMKEVKEMFVFGLVFALEAVPFSIRDENDWYDLDTIIKDDNALNIADVWTLTNIETQNGRLRLANIIVHAVENGFL